jgi:peptide/nickel transport system ATP-binding protein
MTTPLLQVQSATKVYGGSLFDSTHTVALKDFNLTVHADQPTIIALAGESGSGKSTVANLILGFISPTEGSIRFHGTEVGSLNRAQQAAFRKEIQAIFQDPYEVFNPFYRVEHVLYMVIRKFRLAHGRAEANAMMRESLELVGLRAEDVLGKYPHQLSGGQRQRVMIARAFLLRPRLIVADEPVSMLDASLRGQVLEIMMRLKQDFGISIIYVTHDLSTAYQISDRIIVLYQGATVETGDTQPVIERPRHPYTQLLVQSVPVPDPTIRWGKPPASAYSAPEPTPRGCPFAARCPHVMDRCRQSAPPLLPVSETQTAACYLLDG